MTLSANYFKSKSVVDQQCCRALTFALAGLSCVYTCDLYMHINCNALNVVFTFTCNFVDHSSETNCPHQQCAVSDFNSETVRRAVTPEKSWRSGGTMVSDSQNTKPVFDEQNAPYSVDVALQPAGHQQFQHSTL